VRIAGFRRPPSVIFQAISREVKVLRFRLLRIVFNFDKWHIYASAKPEYIKTVHSLANKLENRTKVLEIGCGFGNLIMGCDFKSRVAIDSSFEVVRAAKFLNFFGTQKVNFLNGSFEEGLQQKNVNLLILVNWIHNLSANDLEKAIRELCISSLSSSSYIISEGVKHYRYYHNKEFFTKFGAIVEEILIDDREIFLIRVVNLQQ